MIIIHGNPGAGKTTQTKLLAEYLGCPWFSMGELIRQHTTGKDREQMLAGKTIDDRITIDILWNAIGQLNLADTECIVEGNPRSIPQADWWLGKIKSGQIKLTGIVELVIDPRLAEERLAKRGRTDDQSIKVMENRLAEYKRSTAPTLAYLKDHSLVIHQVDASGTVDQVAASIHQVLGLK